MTVAKPFTFVPILGIGKITIRASSTMRIERLGGPNDALTGVPNPQSYTETCQT